MKSFLHYASSYINKKKVLTYYIPNILPPQPEYHFLFLTMRVSIRFDTHTLLWIQYFLPNSEFNHFYFQRMQKFLHSWSIDFKVARINEPVSGIWMRNQRKCHCMFYMYFFYCPWCNTYMFKYFCFLYMLLS